MKKYNSLPDLVTVYRGNDAQRIVGLSWSTKLEVAESFARGHRVTNNANPVVATTTIAKSEIISCSNRGRMVFQGSDPIASPMQARITQLETREC